MRELRQTCDEKSTLSESEVPQVLARIHDTVYNKILGIDYTIADRKKNQRLRNDYRMDDAKIKQILLDLQSTDFVKSEGSTNPLHPDDMIYVFKKSVILMPRWQENADYKQVILYIKITWPVDDELMFIISFHEDNI